MVTTGQSQSETITISNSGGQPLTINQAALGGANASEFSIVSSQDNCSGQTVPGNGSGTVPVAFAATANGGQTAPLSLPSNGGTATITLTATGAGVTPTPMLSEIS